MSNKLFKDLKTFNRKPKTGFDLSQRRQYTSPMGMMLPVWTDFALPGDKYKLNSSALIRTEPVQTAAFERMKYHIDWFFVPLTCLYQFWPEFYYGTQDINTNFITDSTTLQLSDVPYVNFFEVLDFANDHNSSTGASINFSWFHYRDGDESVAKVDEFGIPYLWNARRLYDLFGYGTIDTSPALSVQKSESNLNLFKYLAYHKIFYSCFNNGNFFKNDQQMYNIDSYVTDVDSATLQVLAPKLMSTIHYRPYRKDYFTNIFPTPQFSSSWANALIQNPILSNDSNVKLSEIIPEGVNSSIEPYFSNNIYSSTGKNLNSNSLYPLIQSAGLNILNGSNDFSGLSSASSVRALMAYDRLLRVTGMAGNHYHEQLKAHYGVTMPTGVQNEAYRLGSQTIDIYINEIVASASTGTGDNSSVLGEIAGKGYGYSDGGETLNFTAPCDGIVMAISSIEPIVDYASQGCEIENRYRTPFDFYHPEFDDLGMQPAYNTFFNRNNIGTSNANNINGWQYRYSEKKTKFDVVNEGFWNTGRQSWVGYKQNLYTVPTFQSTTKPEMVPTWFDLFYIAPQYTNSIFAQQVPYFYGLNASTQAQKDRRLTWDHLEEDGWDAEYTLPSDQQPSEGSQEKVKAFGAPYVYASDNFLINLQINAYKSSIMSLHSLPNLKF